MPTISVFKTRKGDSKPPLNEKETFHLPLLLTIPPHLIIILYKIEVDPKLKFLYWLIGLIDRIEQKEKLE